MATSSVNSSLIGSSIGCSPRNFVTASVVTTSAESTSSERRHVRSARRSVSSPVGGRRRLEAGQQGHSAGRADAVAHRSEKRRVRGLVERLQFVRRVDDQVPALEEPREVRIRVHQESLRIDPVDPQRPVRPNLRCVLFAYLGRRAERREIVRVAFGGEVSHEQLPLRVGRRRRTGSERSTSCRSLASAHSRYHGHNRVVP